MDPAGSTRGPQVDADRAVQATRTERRLRLVVDVDGDPARQQLGGDARDVGDDVAERVGA
jgi:hypothetical protein